MKNRMSPSRQHITPETGTSRLLSPGGAVLGDPAEIEEALAVLWDTAASRLETEAGGPAVTRVCMANLVVVGEAKQWEQLNVVLAQIAREYPSRTVALLVGDEAMADRPPGQVHATVSSVCHLPQPGRPQVCCEQIVLRMGSQDGTGLDRLLLPLLASDVPLLGWWTIDPASCPRLLAAMRQLIDRLIFDAGLPGFASLLEPGRCVTRELGWFRSYRWRELVAGLFDETDPAVLNAIDHVAVAIRGKDICDWLDALWIVAFLGGQLAWRTGRVLGGGRLEFHSPDRAIEVVIDDSAAAGRGLDSFEVAAGRSRFGFARCHEAGDEFRIMLSDENTCLMPRSIQIRGRGRADALAIAMTGRVVDRSYDRAVPLAVWMSEAMKTWL
ncbi:MAG: glucose-6-phosphate dehydrogenase assembly protein OpcA [Phycisphaerae bacterium]